MASGNTLIAWNALCSEPPISNAALIGVRNQHGILQFDDTTNESVRFSAVLPQHYAGGGITAYLHWAHVATTGNVDWDVSFERIGDSQQDIDGDGFASAQSADNNTVPGTTGFVDITSIAFTDGAQVDSIAVGESFRINVTRDAANDTAVGDAQLLKVELRET